MRKSMTHPSPSAHQTVERQPAHSSRLRFRSWPTFPHPSTGLILLVLAGCSAFARSDFEASGPAIPPHANGQSPEQVAVAQYNPNLAPPSADAALVGNSAASTANNSYDPTQYAAEPSSVREAATTAADDEAEGGIQDNSFLIEEAYNQEAGVVQHIFNWVRTWEEDRGHGRFFDFVFTQEWPLGSQKHQFSYTLPFSSFSEHPEGGVSSDEEGIGDMLLNYRYQLLLDETFKLAVAPRFSLILPTGNEHEGLGTGEVGYQLNLPVSKEIGQMAYHFNAGLTVIPDANTRLDDGSTSSHRDLLGYNLGASAIALHSDVVQPMLELVALWDEQIDDTGLEEDTFELLLSPGVRWAPYTKGSNQIVVGAALPIGLTNDSPDLAAFFYLSLEHPFQGTAAE